MTDATREFMTKACEALINAGHVKFAVECIRKRAINLMVTGDTVEFTYEGESYPETWIMIDGRFYALADAQINVNPRDESEFYALVMPEDVELVGVGFGINEDVELVDD